jgi:hypothetical protein
VVVVQADDTAIRGRLVAILGKGFAILWDTTTAGQETSKAAAACERVGRDLWTARGDTQGSRCR